MKHRIDRSIFSDSNEPSPSGDGLDTIDMGDNDADSDYKDDGGDLGFDTGEDLFDAGGGGAGGGGGGFGGGGDAGEDGDGTFSGALTDEEQLSPEEQFVAQNLDSYSLLENDIKNIIVENNYTTSFSDAMGQPSSDSTADGILQKLHDLGWDDQALRQLSFDNEANLKDMITNLNNELSKNVQPTLDVLDTLNRVKGGSSMPDSTNSKFTVENGKVAVKTSEATETKNPSEIVADLQDKLASIIMKARKMNKKAKATINETRGLLFQRGKIVTAMEEMDMGEDMEGEESEGDEMAPEAPEYDNADMEDNASALGDQLDIAGEEGDDIAAVTKELTDAVKALTQAIGTLDVSKTDYDSSMEMAAEGEEIVEEELEDTMDEYATLEKEVAASFSLLKTRRAEHGGPMGEERPDPTDAENKDGTEGNKEKSDATKKESSNGFLNRVKSKKSENNGGVPVNTIQNAEEITQPEQIVPAIEAGVISQGEDFWKIADSVVKAWKTLAGPVKALNASGKGALSKALIKRTLNAYGVTGQKKMANNPSAPAQAKTQQKKEAKWSDIYDPIDATSKVMDKLQHQEYLDGKTGEIAKGYNSFNPEHNQTSQGFPENFGEKYNDLEGSMGDKNLEGKYVSAEHNLSDEQTLKVRKAMEVAFEEQFKNLIKNPLAVSATKHLIAAGMNEDTAIRTAFNILAEGFEPSIKIALHRGFEYSAMNEADLIRRSKDVATYKVALAESKIPNIAGNEPVGEQRTASVNQPRNPVLRAPQSMNAQEAEDAKIDAAFNSLVIR